MTTTTIATTINTIVLIIARVAFKNNPKAVVYLVRASNGVDTYQTTVYDGKVTACNCPARKPCKHMKAVQARENERLVARVDAMVAEAQAKIANKAQEKQVHIAAAEPVVIVVPTIECALCHRPHQSVMLVSCDTCGKRVCVQCCSGPMSATCRVCQQPVRLSREAYNEEFSPCTVPGMY